MFAWVIYRCIWVYPSGKPCDYVQRGPGKCPYAHPEPQPLIRTEDEEDAN